MILQELVRRCRSDEDVLCGPCASPAHAAAGIEPVLRPTVLATNPFKKFLLYMVLLLSLVQRESINLTQICLDRLRDGDRRSWLRPFGLHF